MVNATGRAEFGAGRSHDPETSATGYLYRIDPDLSHSRWDGPYICPNGPAISPDDNTFYHVDTFGGTVWAFDKHPDGTISNRREFARLDSKKKDFRMASQLTMKTGSGLHTGEDHVSPVSAHKENDLVYVELPVSQVTSCTFGGPDLSVLYITTAARNLDFVKYPLAGAVFRMPTRLPLYLSRFCRIVEDSHASHYVEDSLGCDFSGSGEVWCF